MTMEGTGRQIHPNLDVVGEAKPYFLRLVAQRYAPDRLTGDLFRTAMRVSSMAGSMPEQVNEILEDLRKGHLTLKSSDPELPGALDRLGRRVYTGFTVAALVAGGAVIVATDRHLLVGAALLVVAALIASAHVLRDWWRALGIRR